MADEKDLDLRKVFEQATNRMSLQDLAQQGFEKVKVLDEEAVQKMVADAVDRAITTQTAEERQRLLDSSRRELDRLLREHRAARTRAQLLESDKNELVGRVENLERQLQLKEELEEETLHRRLEEGLASLQGQVEDLRRRYQDALGELEAARARTGELSRQLEDARGTREAAVAELDAAQKEAARLREDRDRVQKEAEATLARLGALERQLADEQSRARGAEKARNDLVGQILGLQAREQAASGEIGRLKESLARAQAESGGLRDELRAERGRAEAAGAEARRGLEALSAEAAAAKKDRDGALAELQRARDLAAAAQQEAAFLRGQLAQQQKDQEEQRQKTVFVTAELQQIEEQQKAERDELERLRAEAARGAEDRRRLEKDLAEARSEVQAHQELLGREQEASRQAQNETASLQARLLELQERLQATARDAEVLRVEKAALAERAEVGLRLERLERLLESARKSSTAARASAVRSREAAAELERALARRTRPRAKSRGAATVRGAAAFDGMALLEGFFRKIRLKELIQQHVPVRERPGEAHPSGMLVEVLKAVAAGDRRPDAFGRAAPLEVVGPADGPDVEKLRFFLARLSPQAVRAVGRLHHALRVHLYGAPPKPEALVLDVADLELGLGRKRARRAARPLVCFDPARDEFWNGHYRGNRPPGLAEIPGFLTECLGRVPPPFARRRVRLRMDSAFFNEGVVRLLNARGCGYVIAAPDTRAVRKGARACSFTRLSNGAEVGEFRLRIHPIRKTEARFVVVRRRDSKKARGEGPALFREGRHLYFVYATDARGTPWRSYEFYRGRGASLEKARARLADFTTSRLRGRSRRSVAALFQAYLLASDLVGWFRRSCLPADEKARGPEAFRSDFLLVPPGNGRSLVVLPRKDRRRRLFGRADRLTRRLRPARPFRFRK
jgi:hypothetical protein